MIVDLSKKQWLTIIEILGYEAYDEFAGDSPATSDSHQELVDIVRSIQDQVGEKHWDQL